MNLPSKPETTASQNRTAYWIRTRRLTVLLLLVWFGVTFCVIFFARSLSEFTLFGWSFSYYMAAQGTLFIYLIIVAIYAWSMSEFDKTLVAGENPDEK